MKRLYIKSFASYLTLLLLASLFLSCCMRKENYFYSDTKKNSYVNSIDENMMLTVKIKNDCPNGCPRIFIEIESTNSEFIVKDLDMNITAVDSDSKINLFNNFELEYKDTIKATCGDYGNCSINLANFNTLTERPMLFSIPSSLFDVSLNFTSLDDSRSFIWQEEYTINLTMSLIIDGEKINYKRSLPFHKRSEFGYTPIQL